MLLALTLSRMVFGADADGTAPQPPHFVKSMYKDGAYAAVHEAVGDTIDWYNIQYYNQVSRLFIQPHPTDLGVGYRQSFHYLFGESFSFPRTHIVTRAIDVTREG